MASKHLNRAHELSRKVNESKFIRESSYLDTLHPRTASLVRKSLKKVEALMLLEALGEARAALREARSINAATRI